MTGGADIDSVGIGVLGGGSFVAGRAVLPAIDAGTGVHLAAIASRSGGTDPRWARFDVGTYDAVLAHPNVDAVYLPLPNGLHEEWTARAASAGKAVLCEKPLAADADAAARMVEACRSGGVLLAEAWMTPFDARWRRVLQTVESGAIGSIRHVDARFTFTIGPEASDNYRWDPTQGGGALLDVGIYTLGFPVTLWGTEAESVEVRERTLDDRGVDAVTVAELSWAGGRSARVHCSFVDAEAQRLTIVGEDGTITVDGDAFTGGPDATEHEVSVGGDIERIAGRAGDPYRAMVEAFGAAVRGSAPWPRPAPRSVELLRLIDRIARQDVTPP